MFLCTWSAGPRGDRGGPQNGPCEERERGCEFQTGTENALFGVLVLRAVAWYIAALTQMRSVDAQRFLTTPFSALAARESMDESSVDTSLDGYQTTSRLR